MADYSGYAQRQQQDPNLAAWAQIGGNIANIFGLDPAKAAEARRGLQQEDYNEQRNQAYIRQQLANKRIGELLAGKGFDASRGEFIDPAAYSEFVKAMADMGDARQAVQFAPGRWNAQLKAKVDTENRAWDHRAEVQTKADEARAAKLNDEIAKNKAAQTAKDQSKLERTYNLAARLGGRPLDFGAAPGVANLLSALDLGDETLGVGPAPGTFSGYFEPTADTRHLPLEKQRFIPTEAFTKWLNSAGYGTRNMDRHVRERLYGQEFNHDKMIVAGAIAERLQLPINHPNVVDLTERVYVRELADQAKAKPIITVSSPEELSKVLAEAKINPNIQNILIRYPTINREDGTLTYRYSNMAVPGVLNETKDASGKIIPPMISPTDARHPMNIFSRGGL